MTRLDRYREKLTLLENKRSQLMRQGKYAAMQNLHCDIEELRQLIQEESKYVEAKPLREFLDERDVEASGIIPLIMECHLAADFLADCAFNLKEIIRGLGLEPRTLVPEIQDIIKKSETFASLPCSKGQDLMEAMTDNDTLIAALHKKTLSYIKQRFSKVKSVSAGE